MEHYYLSKEPTNLNEHKIHKSGCVNLPEVENRIYLGCYNNDFDAVEEAKQYCPDVCACSSCLDISFINSFNIVNSDINETQS